MIFVMCHRYICAGRSDHIGNTPEVFNPWGVKPRPEHVHIIYIEGIASLSGFNHTNGDSIIINFNKR
jgi:hypothetical protein